MGLVGGRIENAADQSSIRGMKIMKSLVSRFKKNESGATAIEYGLIAALIAVVIIGAVTLVGTSLQTTFESVSDALTGASGGGDTTTPPAGGNG
jgi:pilus assembly protein Flp/PilA